MALTAGELAHRLSGELCGESAVVLTSAAGFEQAGASDLAFLEAPKWLARAAECQAGCLLVPPGSHLAGRTTIVVPKPRLAFALALELLYPTEPAKPGIHPTAVIAPSARVDPTATIDAHVTIGEGARIGAHAVVGPGSVVGPGAEIGEHTQLVARVVLYPGTVLGARVLVHAGAVLGADGFGFVRGPGGELVKFRQVGRLRIEDDVEIGANTTIDRGALGLTVIGRGSKIDNLVQIAHNVTVGSACAISAQVGIAGSSELAAGVTLAGQVGVADHVRIEAGAIAGAQAGIPSGKIIREGQVVWGTPARPIAEYKRQHARLARLGSTQDELKELQGRVERLERSRGGID